MRQRITVRNVPPQHINVRNAKTIIVVGGEPYYGEYEVLPDFVGKTLLTSGKSLSADVTVYPIGVQRVSNPAGGKTVTIGEILNG